MSQQFSLIDYNRHMAEAAPESAGGLSSFFAAQKGAAKAAAALSTFTNPEISTEEIFAAAQQAILAARGRQKETFVPIFTTNSCDSECLMCGMRKSNSKLVRKFSSKRVIEEQLAILYEVDRVRGCGFLTGEFEGEYTRKANAFMIGWAIRRA
ncbi:MAG: hypothetical protein ACJ74G_08240, partial [Blastocatellia bacterium]